MDLSSLVIAMPGKGNPLLSVRIPDELEELIKAQTLQTGETKSEITIAALLAYLQPSSADDDLIDLKRRVHLIERRLEAN